MTQKTPATLGAPWTRRELIRLGGAGMVGGLGTLLSACGGDGSDEAPGIGGPGDAPAVGRARTTLLIYMIGSDLETDVGLGTGNLEEMQAAGSGPDVNVLVTTGGSKKDGWRTVRRWRIDAEGRRERTELEDLGAHNMGSGDTLRDFIVWGRTSHPAEQYVLVLWDHGGGPNQFYGHDELHTRPSAHKHGLSEGVMLLPEMARALREAEAALAEAKLPADQRQPLELIAFDCCLLASVEVAHALAPHARYLAASEELEPGGGWDYAGLLDFLRRTPQASGEAIGRAIADTYLAKCRRAQQTAITFSVTDLSRVAPLVAALGALARISTAGLQAKPWAAWGNQNHARRQSVDFSTVLVGAGERTDVVDLASLMAQPLYAQQREARQVGDALARAVRYQVADAVYEGAGLGGLTLYVPSNRARSAVYPHLDHWPSAVRDWMLLWQRMAADKMFAGPVLGAPAIKAGELWSSVSSVNFEAVLVGAQHAVPYRDDDGDEHELIFATRPALQRRDAQGKVVAVGAALAADWLLLEGVPVVALEDGATRVAADRARFAIPVAHARRGSNPDQFGYTHGYLLVIWQQDAAGRETWTVDRLETSLDPSPHAAYGPQRSESLKPGDSLYPLPFSVSMGEAVFEPDDLKESLYPLRGVTVPDSYGTKTGWRLQTGPLPVGEARALRLACQDLVGEVVFSKPLPL